MSSDSLNAFVDAAAQALKIPVDDAWKPAVRMNVQLVLQHAARVDAFPLPEDAEPAPIFRA